MPNPQHAPKDDLVERLEDPRLDGPLNLEAAKRITALQADLAVAVEALPNLKNVIDWLKNGCDPQAAVTELVIHRNRIDQALSKIGGQS